MKEEYDELNEAEQFACTVSFTHTHTPSSVEDLIY